LKRSWEKKSRERTGSRKNSEKCVHFSNKGSLKYNSLRVREEHTENYNEEMKKLKGQLTDEIKSLQISLEDRDEDLQKAQKKNGDLENQLQQISSKYEQMVEFSQQ
jgi:predicted nuclease with TOPRIM domain